jgi:Fe-S cluster biogenesis protein NfuA
MFIQTEPMANADVMKFLPGRTVLESGFVEYVSTEEAIRSPLAQLLFGIEGVARVGLDNEAVTIGKAPEKDWQVLKPLILGAIMEHFTSGQPVVMDRTVDEDSDNADPALSAQIEELINTRIKPVAQQDGGDVEFYSLRGGTVYLKLEGSAFGLMSGIQNMLRHYVPEVADVKDYRDILPKPGLESPTGLALKELFDSQINPAVAAHGGHIALLDVTDDAVFIRMEGGCQGCGMSQVTLKQGVETEIRRIAPEIKEIYDTTQHAEGQNPYYQGGMNAS